jgi:hypothetical protein
MLTSDIGVTVDGSVALCLFIGGSLRRETLKLLERADSEIP